MPTVKHGCGVAMIWGCMTIKGVGRTEFIEFTMDKYAYLNIFKRNLKQSAEELDLENGYYFQQANNPKQTAGTVTL